MTPEFAFFGLAFIILFVLWSYVNEQQALEDYESYDDEKKRYKRPTDGDNT